MQATVRDLYAEKDIGRYAEHFTALVEPHGVVAVTITPANVLPYFDQWRPWEADTKYMHVPHMHLQ